MNPAHRVIVLGAGPVGLTLAYRLAELGAQVTVLESEPAVSRQLRASTFHPPTLDFFSPSGITGVLIKHGRITPTWQIRLHETTEHVTFDLSVLADETAHPYRLQCEQGVLSEELERRLLKHSSVTIRRGTAVQAVGQSAESVWAQLQGSDERLEAAYLVGCDGAHSLVRKAIGANFEGNIYPDMTLLATTPFDFGKLMPDLAGVNYIWQDSGTYSLLHLPHIWRVSLHPESDQSLETEADPVRIARRLDALFPEAGPFEVTEVRPYRVHKRLASKWRHKRMLIAGDAAHLNNPKGGMGMNGGIHDAFCLADLLIKRLGGAPDVVLDDYERQRLPVVRDDIIGQADKNHERMQLKDLKQRRESLARLQALVDDRPRCQAYLRQTSMLEGLAKARALV